MSDEYRERKAEWQRRREKYDVAGELRAERLPMPELAVTDDPVLRRQAAADADRAIQSARRAVNRAMYMNVESLSDRARRARTPEQRIAVREHANRYLADADYSNWHPRITKILQMLEV